jgi:hypothetical protein
MGPRLLMHRGSGLKPDWLEAACSRPRHTQSHHTIASQHTFPRPPRNTSQGNHKASRPHPPCSSPAPKRALYQPRWGDHLIGNGSRHARQSPVVIFEVSLLCPQEERRTRSGSRNVGRKHESRAPRTTCGGDASLRQLAWHRARSLGSGQARSP